MDDLKVHTEEHDQSLLIRLTGHLFLPGVAPVMAMLADGLRSRPHHTVICDLSELAVPMSDWVLTAFPATLRRVGGWPAYSLRLAAPGTELEHRLMQLRMHRYLPVHPTVPEALQHARLDADVDPHLLSVEPDPLALRRLRHTVRKLWPHPRGHGRDEAELVVNELAANVIKHVGQPFTVALAFLPMQALVAVTDPSRDEPVRRSPRGGGTSGNGLQVISQLSQDWGVRLVHGNGKTVWAILPSAAGAGPTTGIPRTRRSIG